MHKGDTTFLDPTRAPSVFDIDVVRVARVYAEALLNAAEKKGRADEIWEELATLVHGGGGSVDPITLLTHTAIPRRRRGEIIRQVFAGKADDLLFNFLMVLNGHQRLDTLRAVAAVYHELKNDRAKRVGVQVRSAVPLTEAEREQVKVLARRRFGLEPILAEAVDPTVLGGLRIQVGDQVIDATVRTRLESLKNQLLARSSYAIRR
jgi:F-type H+-transporting ATPase subunit delta